MLQKSQEKTHLQYYAVFIEKNPCISGPIRVKPILFESQLYFSSLSIEVACSFGSTCCKSKAFESSLYCLCLEECSSWIDGMVLHWWNTIVYGVNTNVEFQKQLITAIRHFSLLEISLREFRSSKQVLVVLKINHGVWHNGTVLVWDQKTAFKSWFFYLRTVVFDKFLKLKFNFITCTIEVMEELGTIYKLLSSEYSK